MEVGIESVLTKVEGERARSTRGVKALESGLVDNVTLFFLCMRLLE
jgi:hypothetical protein